MRLTSLTEAGQHVWKGTEGQGGDSITATSARERYVLHGAAILWQMVWVVVGDTCAEHTSSALMPDALRRVRLGGSVAKRSAKAASGSTTHRSTSAEQRASAGHTAGPAVM